MIEYNQGHGEKGKPMRIWYAVSLIFEQLMKNEVSPTTSKKGVV